MLPYLAVLDISVPRNEQKDNDVVIISYRVKLTAVDSVFVWSIWAVDRTRWSLSDWCLEVSAGERADEEEDIGSCSVPVPAFPAHVLVISANRNKQ